jgi:hypothetical protein
VYKICSVGKAKGWGAMFLMNRISYAVQDLTNPSLASLASVELAARTHPILGVEANSRQFFPAANAFAATVHSGLYRVRNGVADTSTLRGTGLGMQVEKMTGLVKVIERNGCSVV